MLNIQTSDITTTNEALCRSYTNIKSSAVIDFTSSNVMRKLDLTSSNHQNIFGKFPTSYSYYTDKALHVVGHKDFEDFHYGDYQFIPEQSHNIYKDFTTDTTAFFDGYDVIKATGGDLLEASLDNLYYSALHAVEDDAAKKFLHLFTDAPSHKKVSGSPITNEYYEMYISKNCPECSMKTNDGMDLENVKKYLENDYNWFKNPYDTMIGSIFSTIKDIAMASQGDALLANNAIYMEVDRFLNQCKLSPLDYETQRFCDNFGGHKYNSEIANEPADDFKRVIEAVRNFTLEDFNYEDPSNSGTTEYVDPKDTRFVELLSNFEVQVILDSRHHKMFTDKVQHGTWDVHEKLEYYHEEFFEMAKYCPGSAHDPWMDLICEDTAKSADLVEICKTREKCWPSDVHCIEQWFGNCLLQAWSVDVPQADFFVLRSTDIQHHGLNDFGAENLNFVDIRFLMEDYVEHSLLKDSSSSLCEKKSVATSEFEIERVYHQQKNRGEEMKGAGMFDEGKNVYDDGKNFIKENLNTASIIAVASTLMVTTIVVPLAVYHRYNQKKKHRMHVMLAGRDEQLYNDIHAL